MLGPMLALLVQLLEGDGNAEAAQLFAEIERDLRHAASELDLLGLFTFRLANADEIVAACRIEGPARQFIDLILDRAMRIAAACTADDDHAH